MKIPFDYDASEVGLIKPSADPGDECEVTIPNPSGNAPAVITMRREQIVQDIEETPDALEFNFTLKLTEEQMLEIQNQWAENDELARLA